MMFHPVSPIVLSSASGCSLGPVSTFSSTVENSAKSGVDSMVEEQLIAMLQQERCYRVEVIPCTAGDVDATTSSSARLPYEEWRRKICEWCFKLVDHFRIDREVVGVALNFFDRFLYRTNEDGSGSTCRCPSCQRALNSSTFQLGAMSALYLAIKLHSEPGDDPLEEKANKRKLRLYSFVELSRGQFTADDICAMERKMLETLKWRINPPTPMTVVSYLLRLMPKRAAIPLHCRYNYDLVLHVIHELSRYLTELSVCLAKVSSISLPSEVAFASILVSMEMITVVALPTQVRDDFCDAVAGLSSMRGRTDDKIRFLKGRLRTCFSPDMLMDDCDIDKQHPISVARESGLLDMSILLQHRAPLPSIRKQDRKPSSTTVMIHHEHPPQHDMDDSLECITP